MADPNEELYSSVMDSIYRPGDYTKFTDVKTMLAPNNVDSTTTSSFVPFLSQENKDMFNAGLKTGNGESPFGSLGNLFSDKYTMGNITGLASTLMQAAALPSMLKNAKLQNKSLQFNLDTAKQEQARRNSNIASFNAPRQANNLYANKSAFV